MGRGNIRRRTSRASRDKREITVDLDSTAGVYVDRTKLKRERPTHNQATPSRLPNVDVHAILFALIMIVFVFYPLAQMALGL